MSTETTDAATPLLSVRNVSKTFPLSRGLFGGAAGEIRALDNVSFDVPSGAIVGLVGESGCGKTTMGHTIMGGLSANAGEIIFDDPELGPVDIAHADKDLRRHVRLNMQMVFQDPNASLNPRMTLFDLVAEPLRINNLLPKAELRPRVSQLLEQVGLSSRYLERYPHALSGGQRQRVVIARALAMNPQLVVADEPISALDVSIQAQTLNLLKDLQASHKLTYLFIAHDLSVVKYFTDETVVMYLGRVVETGPTRPMFETPLHPYTWALLNSVPRLGRDRAARKTAAVGEVPSAANPPPGCHFHPRCPFAQEICRTSVPDLRQIAPGRQARCHFAGELPLGIDAEAFPKPQEASQAP